MAEIDISQVKSGTDTEPFLAAVKRAREDDRTTWITSSGQRIAAIVPVEIGEVMDYYAPPQVEGGLVLPPGAQLGYRVSDGAAEIVLADGTHLLLADWAGQRLVALAEGGAPPLSAPPRSSH